MKYPIFCYRDLKAGSYSPPFICVNNEVAERDFDYRIHNDNSMGFSPADYDLFLMGYFDSNSGKIEGITIPEFIVNGAELV